MSILGAMYAAVSGLQANSNALGIISDNISNANTVGYKDATTDFLSLVTNAGGQTYAPGGVETKPLYDIEEQGAIEAASSPTDLAISGNGFFVVNTNSSGTAGGGTTEFTRAGNFTIDSTGNLVNAAGLYLQGEILTPAESAAIANGQQPTLSSTTVGSLQTINVNTIGGTASGTANVTLAANLPADDTTTPETLTVPVYDTQGVEHDMELTFTPTGTANQWSVSASFANAGATTVSIAAGDNIVQFNSDGTLNAAGTTFNAANALSINWDPTVSGGTSPQNLTFNVGTDGSSNGLSQFGSNFSVSDISQDGVQFGSFSSVTIESNGLVVGQFSNGLTRPIAIIPIATFGDADGLTSVSDDAFLQSTTSGGPLLDQAGTGSAGEIQSSSLENSTVDIATEFSDLIIAQQAYSANSKVLTTADQMTQSLLSIQTG